MYRESQNKLEEVIGYHFQDPELLTLALTHSSYVNEHNLAKKDCNERVEFLGDAVLEIVSSDFLYHLYPDEPEGKLTRTRASIVCEPVLDFCARSFGLEKYLILGKGEETTGGRNRASLVSDACEALIGAIYLDGGLANAKEFIMRFILNDLEEKQLFFDSKTILQEMLQKEHAGTLTYEVVGENGPEHDKMFTVRALVGSKEIGRGTGHTKKAAEQQAAYQAILHRKENGQGQGTACI